MSKPKTPRDVQVRHRVSGAALLGMKEPAPPVMAVDAQPRAGDPVRANPQSIARVFEETVPGFSYGNRPKETL